MIQKCVKLKKGFVQVYTGEGKGKTTAALGLAMRAAGQGLKVYVLQFLKPQRLSSGEVKFQTFFKNKIKIERLNTPWWSLNSFKKKDHIEKYKKILASKLKDLKEIILSNEYDLIILDEVNNCLHHNFLNKFELLTLIKGKPSGLELVLTGRNAPDELIEAADLVTEMKCIKHPYTTAISARKGIEY